MQAHVDVAAAERRSPPKFHVGPSIEVDHPGPHVRSAHVCRATAPLVHVRSSAPRWKPRSLDSKPGALEAVDRRKKRMRSPTIFHSPAAGVTGQAVAERVELDVVRRRDAGSSAAELWSGVMASASAAHAAAGPGAGQAVARAEAPVVVHAARHGALGQEPRCRTSSRRFDVVSITPQVGVVGDLPPRAARRSR